MIFLRRLTLLPGYFTAPEPRSGRLFLLVTLLLVLSPLATSGTVSLVPPWLEIPQAASRVPANDTVDLDLPPDQIQRIVLHIPAGGSRINYGTIHTRVNTEATDGAMKSSSGSDGIALNIDLTAAGGFALRPGANSIEINYEDQFGRDRYFNYIVRLGSVASSSRDTPGKIVTLPPESPSSRTLAVVIGISQYTTPNGGIKQLQYADRDALAFAAFLRSPAGGNVSESNLRLLINKDATIARIREALFDFLALTHEQDTAIIYIAGHGGANLTLRPENLFFMASDSNIHDLGSTALPMWQLQDVFARIIRAHRVITFVDTCHSFGLTGVRITDTSDAHNLFNQYLERYASGAQRAVIAASDIGEVSCESARWGGGHGVFTWLLMRGLRGEADRNHDGTVTAGELFDFVQPRVHSETLGIQNPRKMDGLAASLALTDLRKSLPSLSLIQAEGPRQSPGPFKIEECKGDRTTP